MKGTSLASIEDGKYKIHKTWCENYKKSDSKEKLNSTYINRIVVSKSKKELDKCYRNSKEQVITLN